MAVRVNGLPESPHVRGLYCRSLYTAVRGGHPWLYGADTLVAPRPVVLVEGEFDTQLVSQEAGDLISSVSLGSARKGLSCRGLYRLKACDPQLEAYDADREGRDGARRLRTSLPRLRTTLPARGKDVTRFWQLGGDVRAWLIEALCRSVRWPSLREMADCGADSISQPALLLTIGSISAHPD